MSRTIIISPGQIHTRIGICSNTLPTNILPSEHLPLIPSRTFSTNLLLFCATHLSVSKETLKEYTLIIAEPCINFDDAERQSIRHGAINHLHVQDVTFASWEQWAGAMLGLQQDSIHGMQPVLLIDVGWKSTRIMATHGSEIVARGSMHVSQALADKMTNYSGTKFSVQKAASIIGRWGIIPPTRNHSGVGGMIDGKYVGADIRSIGGKILFDDIDEEYNIAYGIARLLQNAPDVYTRACLANRLVVTGGGARMWGFVDRLIAEFKEASKLHQLGKLQLAICDTSFAPEDISWVGASLVWQSIERTRRSNIQM